MAPIGSFCSMDLLPLPANSLIDARGLKCPLPVLKLEKLLATLEPGAHCTILADDPIARIDIPLLCKKGGHTCTIDQQDAALKFSIVKKSA
jgi:tRNA 2-thiouridine synthesizing protein A